MAFESHSTEEQLKPVHEESEVISYLGVELEKAKNREHAPKVDEYKDYINDEFSLELQKKLAISFSQGDPILIEGGTSIGKTTTVKKMCSDLGWEVHYANVNGATDVEDLMGRYIPNPKKSKEGDPDYAFADGKITSGLRQEDGKIKVVIIDEINAASPNILIRLHEILDALERDGEIVLSEDASEVIGVNKEKTKIVALMNPPGKGFLQREPLDPAQLRRWVYQKEATDLPSQTFKNATDALFNLAPKTQEIKKEKYLISNESTLNPEQLAEIPGIREITAKYQEFHSAAKELVKKRKVAQDQPQAFTYDDRMEPRRIRDFITNFYRGDINQTFKDALRYYYIGKVLDPAEKQKLEELVKLVEAPVVVAESRRRPLGSGPQKVEGASLKELVSTENLFKTMGHPEAFFGPADVEETFGFKLNPEQVPPIPFTKEQLENAIGLGMKLVLQVGKTPEGEALTIDKMTKVLSGKTPDGKPIISNDTYELYKDSDMLKKETPRFGWKLVTGEVMSDTKDKTYLEQTKEIIRFIKEKVYENKPLPKRFSDAIEDFQVKQETFKELVANDNLRELANVLQTSYISNLTREKACEVVYRLLIDLKKNGIRGLQGATVLTNSPCDAKDLLAGSVIVGNFKDSGITFHDAGVDRSSNTFGATFSTMYL
jgi:MoxR-like ATPase